VVRHGRLIGIDGAFINQVAETAINLLENTYPNLREREDFIKGELQREEAAFLVTLERGEKLLTDIISELLTHKKEQISGEYAFTLYDTYGFPLELTQEVAEEVNLTVDIDGFNQEMKKQQERSKAAHETIDLTVQGSIDQLAEHIHPTAFLGYTKSQSVATVEAVLIEGKSEDSATAGTEVQIILDQTPFYAESGGQIGDKGYLTGEDLMIRVEDVQKESGFFIHFGTVERGIIKVGDRVSAIIDRACRRRAQANHTATHLLQAALKNVVDDSISQAGSLVAFDRLRFDFNCPRPLTADELQQIEDQINTWIAEAHDIHTAILPLAEAKAKGAIAMFGEKYGTEVRVIDVPGVSMELCGGTHVQNTAEIGLFKIMSESGIASGVRRIEAVAGPAVLAYLNERDTVVKDLCDRFKVKPLDIPERITSLQWELKASQKQVEALQQELAIAKSAQVLADALTIGSFKLLVAEIAGVDPNGLTKAAEKLQQKLGESAVILGSVVDEGKVSLVAAFSPKVVKEKQLQAGKFIGTIAKICSGGGGGRPNLAQAGGRDATKLKEALETAKKQLIEALNVSSQ
jgi:alanyl-tRNA synthetase